MIPALLALAGCGAAPPAAPPPAFTSGVRALPSGPVDALAAAPSDRLQPVLAWRGAASSGAVALGPTLANLGPVQALPAAWDLGLSRLAGGAVLALVGADGLSLRRLDGRGEPMQAPLSVASGAVAADVAGTPSGAVAVAWIEADGAVRGVQLASMLAVDHAEPISLGAAAPGTGWVRLTAASDGSTWAAWSGASGLTLVRWRGDTTEPLAAPPVSPVGLVRLVDGAVAWADQEGCHLAPVPGAPRRLGEASCAAVDLARTGEVLVAAWVDGSPPAVRMATFHPSGAPIGEPLTASLAEPPAQHDAPTVAAWTERGQGGTVKGVVAWRADGVPHVRAWQLGAQPLADAAAPPPPPPPAPGPSR